MDIPEAQKAQYREEGYFILERVIPEEDLEVLRAECQRYIDEIDAQLEREQKATQGITHRHRRYFISNRHRNNPRLQRYIFNPAMEAICRATLGDNAYLFWEQFVVKGPEAGMKFGWHQDSGYIGFDHEPYMSCWCALDDMSEENGTVYVLPFSRAGTRSRQEHIIEEGTNDKIGYFGDDPGVPVVAPAGSVAVFSSVTFHRSSPNTTPRMRRVYLTQYSGTPILTKDGKHLWGNALPFIRDGRRVMPEWERVIADCGMRIAE
jgi:ectoine hydroxylase-related dioxygenase (phytanoyl-CoA dioxygenase family)